MNSQRDVRVVSIDYTPHYHTLTRTGSSNFQRIADATAELIDNSIQACSLNTADIQRNVHLGIYLKRSGHGILACLDNGRGMNEQGIKEFATYSLDQETRGNHPTAVADNLRASFISKFGVGAKQAGFFLGKSIT